MVALMLSIYTMPILKKQTNKKKARHMVRSRICSDSQIYMKVNHLWLHKN